MTTNQHSEWEKEYETPRHLMTVLDTYAHAGRDDNMTHESLKQAIQYIESWVEYRSAQVNSLLEQERKKIREKVEGIIESYINHSSHNPNDRCLHEILSEVIKVIEGK